jgi:uncharacterized protein YjaZ
MFIIILVVLSSTATQGQFLKPIQRSLDAHVERVKTNLNISSEIEVRKFTSTVGHKNRFTKTLNGYTTVEDRVIVIYLSSKLDKWSLHSTLSHELVHAWQYEQGHLIAYKHGWWFKDAFYPIDTPYKKLPFETEAFKLCSNKQFR